MTKKENQSILNIPISSNTKYKIRIYAAVYNLSIPKAAEDIILKYFKDNPILDISANKAIKE